jgi:hypothetical protein
MQKGKMAASENACRSVAPVTARIPGGLTGCSSDPESCARAHDAIYIFTGIFPKWKKYFCSIARRSKERRAGSL